MQPAGAPQTLAEMYDLEPDENISYDMAIRITSALSMTKLSRPDHVDRPRRQLTPAVLPMKDPPDLSGRKTGGSCAHMVDIVLSVDDTFDREAVLGLMKVNHYMDLPGVLAPKTTIVFNYKMNLMIQPNASNANKVDIYKHFIFEAKPTWNICANLCQGQMHAIDFEIAKYCIFGWFWFINFHRFLR